MRQFKRSRPKPDDHPHNYMPHLSSRPWWRRYGFLGLFVLAALVLGTVVNYVLMQPEPPQPPQQEAPALTEREYQEILTEIREHEESTSTASTDRMADIHRQIDDHTATSTLSDEQYRMILEEIEEHNAL